MNRLELIARMNRKFWQTRWTRLAAMGLLLTGSSCSSVSQYVKNTFQKDKTPAIAENADEQEANDAEVKHAYASATKKQTQVEPLEHTKKAPSESSQSADAIADQKSSVSDGASAEKQADVLDLIAKGKDPFGGSVIQQTSSEEIKPEFAFPEQSAADDPAIQHAIEPRETISSPLASASGACPPIPTNECPPSSPCSARPFPDVEIVGDEFVCDGGDQGTPVHYQGLDRAGLDVEDTIAEFKDEDGNVHMKPSTKACVYAPRFGAVSSATSPLEDLSVDKAAGHQDLASIAGLETKTVIDEQTQSDEAQDVRMRARASGLNNREAEDQLHQAVAAEDHIKLQNAYEDFRFIREGQFDRANSAVVSLSILAAQEWADGRRPIIVANDQSGQIVQGRFTAQDYTGVEDRRTPGELQLVKVADRASAHPGDIVTFTIRFDNVGGRDLFSVRVVDNLSPRLEYIEGSVSSNLDGTVDVQDNSVGGKLLTFEFDQPLKGKTGGFVSFQCRVR